ncbi:hypothetical protein EC991_006081 [Linnemannia zychae]|nr:hypothetical protein EC991_006081 [Linnemannia zychae]
MATQGTHINVQAVRRVYEDEETTENPTSGRTMHIVCHSDASSGKVILLWDDVLAVFDTALYVRSGNTPLSFLKGPNLKNLDPLRIAAVPGVTLDIIVRGQLTEKELSVTSLHKTLLFTPQENNSASMVTTTDSTAIKPRRNPVGGLVEKAMDA